MVTSEQTELGEKAREIQMKMENGKQPTKPPSNHPQPNITPTSFQPTKKTCCIPPVGRLRFWCRWNSPTKRTQIDWSNIPSGIEIRHRTRLEIQ
jgi:hypothetical protein